LPPASAVSRFLQRFSRSHGSSPSPRNSLALSSDDLEFLSDVRSKSTDPSHTVDTLIGGLESTVDGTESGVFSGKLPPLLPPPPNVSPPPSHGLIAPPRSNTSNRDSLISPDDPVENPMLDLQSLTERPIISALTPLTPIPIRTIDTPRLMSLDSPLSPPMPLDKITSSPGVSALPSSSSQPNPVMNSRSVIQPQLQMTSGHTAQSLDNSQDDDEFSDFSSSPADPPLLPFNVSLPSQDQVRVPMAQSPLRQSASPFDDLVHLMSSPTTGPPTTFQEPDILRGFSFTNPARPTTPSLPKPRESTPEHRASPDLQNTTLTHGRSNSQQPMSPTKATPTSPKQMKIAQGHQRTQSLLDLAAARQGRWPAPPSPLPEPILPPPPPSERSEGGSSVTNVDYFGLATPTVESSVVPPRPPGKAPRLPPLNDAASSQVGSSTKILSSPPSAFDALAPPCSGSPSFTLSAPPAGQSARRTLSPPPVPTAIMNRPSSKPPSSSSTPVPLLPPPSGFRFASATPTKPSPAQLSPDSTPLALLIDNGKGKNIGLPPAAKAAPPPQPPVKGTGGLSAQDLSFFEGL
jgi:hypothetical protein